MASVEAELPYIETRNFTGYDMLYYLHNVLQVYVIGDGISVYILYATNWIISLFSVILHQRARVRLFVIE